MARKAQHRWSLAECTGHMLYLNAPLVPPKLAKDRHTRRIIRLSWNRNLLRRATAAAVQKTRKSHSVKPEQRTVSI